MTLSTSAVAVCCCSDFAQLVEQPSVLDGNDSLICKIGHKFDLLCGERSDLLAEDGYCTDKPLLFEHRHIDDCACASQVGDSDDSWIGLEVRQLRPKILGVRYPLRPGDMC